MLVNIPASDNHLHYKLTLRLVLVHTDPPLRPSINTGVDKTGQSEVEEASLNCKSFFLVACLTMVIETVTDALIVIADCS